MRILDVRDVTVGLQGAVTNAVVSFRHHTVSIVALVSDQIRKGQQVIGFGFNSIGRFAQSGIIRERLKPRVLGVDPADLLFPDGSAFDPEALLRVAMRDEKPGGHGDRAGAVAALELAIWDLNAKLADEPAYVTIGRHFGYQQPTGTAAVYAAGGYYHGDSGMAGLREELAAYVDMGFDAFKIKVGGAPLQHDLERINTALEMAGDSSRLAVDANGRFGASEAATFGQAIAGLGLRWFEEPGDPLDFELLRGVASAYPGPLATGENLFSCVDARNLVRYGGMRPGADIFQMDPGLSYGIGEYARMLDVLETYGHDRSQCFPHGGHLINLHVAVGLGLGGCEAYPGVFGPVGGYSRQCEIRDGQVKAPDAPGFGLETKQDLRPMLQQLGEGS